MDEKKKSEAGYVAGRSMVEPPDWKRILELDQAKFDRDIYSNGKGTEIAKRSNLGALCQAMEGVIR